MQRLSSQLTKGKKIVIVLSFLYEMMVFAFSYPYAERDDILVLAIFSLPTALLWSSVWIWGWWMFSRGKHLKFDKIQAKALTTEAPKIKKDKKSKDSYMKFWLYLLCGALLFSVSSYVQPYGDILSAIFKSLAVFCSIVAFVIWKRLPSPGEKKEKKQEKQSHLRILLFCVFFIVGGTFLGKYSALKMNGHEYPKLETFSDLGITQYQMEKELTKQCKTSQDVPEIIKSYFCPCFGQLMTDIIKENEKDLIEKIKQIAMKNNIKDPKKEGFMYGMSYMNDKLKNDPVIQRELQRCLDESIEQAKKTNLFL